MRASTGTKRKVKYPTTVLLRSFAGEKPPSLLQDIKNEDRTCQCIVKFHRGTQIKAMTDGSGAVHRLGLGTTVVPFCKHPPGTRSEQDKQLTQSKHKKRLV